MGIPKQELAMLVMLVNEGHAAGKERMRCPSCGFHMKTYDEINNLYDCVIASCANCVPDIKIKMRRNQKGELIWEIIGKRPFVLNES